VLSVDVSRQLRSMRIAGALLGSLCENSELLLLKLRAALVLERKEPATRTLVSFVGCRVERTSSRAAVASQKPSAFHGALLRQPTQVMPNSVTQSACGLIYSPTVYGGAR
jgi:hypothetical protein